MTEAREHFKVVTHIAGVNLKVHPTLSEEERYHILPYKYLGRTERYQNYLEAKNDFNNKFMLHHKLVRRILNECVVGLPNILCNIR